MLKPPCKISAGSTTSGGSDELASGNELKRRKMSNKLGPGGDAASATVTTAATSIADERKTSTATLPGSTSVCFSCLNRQMRNFGQNLRPERWKTLLAFLYVLLVSWITAFVMVIVHDRVPDMERYPPLPDLLLGEREEKIYTEKLCQSFLQSAFPSPKTIYHISRGPSRCASCAP